MIDQLGYEPVDSGRYWLFEKPFEQGRVRLDLLTGPVSPEQRPKVRIKAHRVRARGDVELHAHLTAEAVGLDIEPLSLPLPEGVSILVPNAFTFVMMKLHAFRDRVDDGNKELGRHHALDVYRLLAMFSPAEDELARRLREEHRRDAAVVRAAEIAREMFGNMTSVGVLRMREHALASDALQIQRALDLLHDVFAEPE